MAQEQFKVFFSDYFGVSTETMEKYGAFDVPLKEDIPVFIDPFRLYASPKPKYQELHNRIVAYLRFLCQYCNSAIPYNEVSRYFEFREVQDIHMGFCGAGTSGRGLGPKFGKEFKNQVSAILNDVSEQRVTESCHLEKLVFVTDGVGCDFISDLTVNLIKDYLLEFTSKFAREQLLDKYCQCKEISHARFSFELQEWVGEKYYLPIFERKPVILVPRDLLTRDDTWINKKDFINSLEMLPDSIGNNELQQRLRKTIAEAAKAHKKKKEIIAKLKSFWSSNPEIVDWYIKHKEVHKKDSLFEMDERIDNTTHMLRFLPELMGKLRGTRFFGSGPKRQISLTEAREKAEFFKHAIEDMDVYKVLYPKGKKCFDEKTIQQLFKLVWGHTDADVSFESNNGRGPADVKVSVGAKDKCIIEFKLASNTKLKDNLQKQVEIYKKAHDAQWSLCIIVFTTDKERTRVNTILKDVGLLGNANIYLVDASPKESASNVKA